MALGRPTIYRKKYCDQLIDHMAKGLSFESFAGVLGVCKQTLYNWEALHVDFVDAKKRGTEKSRLFWEKLGIAGACGKIKNFNAASYIFNKKNRFRDEWADAFKHDHQGGVDTQVLITLPSNQRDAKLNSDDNEKGVQS